MQHHEEITQPPGFDYFYYSLFTQSIEINFVRFEVS